MELTIEKAKFHQISLKQVSEALKKGLSKNYIEVDVSIVECPDLRKWDCPAEGISGNQRIIDVGGEPYMHDKRFIGTEFDYEEIAKNVSNPLLANITEFGMTPLFSHNELAEAGVKIVLHPLSAFRAMSKAAEKVYATLASGGDHEGLLDKMQTRDEL